MIAGFVGHRVVTAAAPGVAANNALYAKPSALKKAMFLQSL